MRNTIVLASLCLTACAVGPDFKNPDAPGHQSICPRAAAVRAYPSARRSRP